MCECSQKYQENLESVVCGPSSTRWPSLKVCDSGLTVSSLNLSARSASALFRHRYRMPPDHLQEDFSTVDPVRIG